ncbi:MalY/PatB family protein [Arthrobacter sp. A2-55]|uniref:MalY/PatB family protein n=1 Tax=Arthrobacter sp. A2-55 TaxID=2897337 RepID=UPI0021CDE088|nr:aminotransferase class I/II-fold pyridoxal phosphate-dependent enzyme [Arthrobacter sp. A2-55]MCU6479987.1 aminotransferase class I/II-fold pyridoxal phosphate-dependent enzyme [Arthrobacter sp. A2-55]
MKDLPGRTARNASARFDAITADELRAAGSLKWTGVEDRLPAWVAEMDFGLAAPIAGAVQEAVARGLVGYLPGGLIDEMGAACSEFLLARHGWEVPADWIRPVADVLTALEWTVRHFSAQGAKIVVPTPAYMPFLELPAVYGRELVTVPMLRTGSGWELDFPALDAALAGGGLLILCNPHNPLGKVYSRDELARIAEIVAANGARVFSDEIHAPLVYDGGTHVPYASVSPAAANHTVTATSASKAWNLAGLKAAQMILSNAADRELWAGVGHFVEHGPSTPGVVANIAAYRDGGAWLAEVLAYLDGNRQLLGGLLGEHLPGAAYIQPAGTYLAFIDCTPLPLGGAVPADYFRDHARVALVDGAACGRPGWVRLNFATPRPILRRIVEEMGAAVRRQAAATEVRQPPSW